MPADQGLIDSVANANNKTVVEMAAWSTAQVMATHAQAAADQAAHRNRVNVLAETYLARALKAADEVDPEQAAATLKLLTGNDQANAMASLGAVVAQLQQLMKGAQSTPPETAVPK